MTQKAGTYEVVDGFLMSGDERVNISHCRVVIEPLSQPMHTSGGYVSERRKGRWERFADSFSKSFLLGCALYFLAIVIHAFTSGAFAAAVR